MMQSIIDNLIHPFLIQLSSTIGIAVGWVWFYPVVILCLFCGVFFTLRFSFVQFKSIPHAIQLLRGKYDNPKETGHITHFQALMAAISGTIGLGNIAGVAIAISLGGPGTIFWMWVVGILGMATKFVECTLGTKYRITVGNQVQGGPMHYISQRCPSWLKPLAGLFAVSSILGAFGAGGMFQSNQAATALSSNFGMPIYLTGLILSGLVALVIIGGIKRIGNVASKIVPSMCIVYILGAIAFCIMNIDKLGWVLSIILTDAFSGAAVAGGSIGTVIIWGVRRGIFSNEAGLGSASIAHAAVKTDHPIREGIVASFGPFIDTIIVCTATAIVIILSGEYNTDQLSPRGPVIHFESPNHAKQITGSAHNVVMTNSLTNHYLEIPQTSGISRVVSPPLTISKIHTTWYNTPITSMTGSFIQFKSKRSTGNYAISILNANQNRLITLDLRGDTRNFLAKQSSTDELTPVSFTLTTTMDTNGWQRHTISFDNSTKQWISAHPENHQLYLAFLGSDFENPIMIDDIVIGDSKNGIELTIASFDRYFEGFGSLFIAIAVSLFAFSTMITWSYYGEVASTFVFGKGSVFAYKLLFIALIFIGSVTQLTTVLNFSDLAIGLMVLPNAIAILYLSNDVLRDKKTYFTQLKDGKFKQTK